MRKQGKLPSTLALAVLLAAVFTAADGHKQPSHRDDIVIADFEGPDYAGWIATGNAFGSHPARKPEGGELLHTAAAGQRPRPITGYVGNGLATSIFNGTAKAPNAAKGTLTSPLFEIRRDDILGMIFRCSLFRTFETKKSRYKDGTR